MSEKGRDILRFTYCPGCGYDLEGLPRKYVCPECEYPYDETMSMVWVWNAGEGPNISSVILNTLLVVIFFSIFLSMLWVGPGTRGGAGWLVCLFFGVGSFATLRILIRTLRNYRLRKEDTAACALVMAPSGYMVIRKGDGQWKSWNNVHDFKLRPMREERWDLRLNLKLLQSVRKPRERFIFKGTSDASAAISERIRKHIDDARGAGVD